MILIATALALSWLQAHPGATCVSCDGMFGNRPEVSVCKQGALRGDEVRALCETAKDEPRT